MDKEELLKQRKNVICILLIAFVVGFVLTYFIMDIPNIYYNETYSVEINGRNNDHGIDLFKKHFSNDAYLYAENIKEFYPGLEVEAINIEGNAMKFEMGYGTKSVLHEATLTVKNNNTGEIYNIRGAVRSADDTTPRILLKDVMSVISYDHSLNTWVNTINVNTN